MTLSLASQILGWALAGITPLVVAVWIWKDGRWHGVVNTKLESMGKLLSICHNQLLNHIPSEIGKLRLKKQSLEGRMKTHEKAENETLSKILKQVQENATIARGKTGEQDGSKPTE